MRPAVRSLPAVSAIAAALLLAVLPGCASDRGERGRADQAEAPAAAAPLDSSRIVIEPIDAPGLLAAVRAPGAKATLVNVWASWCQPCREEFPDLLRVARDWEERGFRLVFVSADFAEDVPNAKVFLAEQGVGFPTYLKTGDDMQFIDTLDPRWSGALPGSFLYDSSGRLVRFWEGKASEDSLRARILPVLDAAPSS
jgi:thiol-disulfide isomerase/thioredoxin